MTDCILEQLSCFFGDEIEVCSKTDVDIEFFENLEIDITKRDFNFDQPG